MTPLSQQILDRFQVRKTAKQKTAFIQLLQDAYPNLQLQEGGLLKNRNLILGDVDKAKFVLTAHYDTCPRLPFPNFIAPKNPALSIAYSLLIVLPLILAMIVFSAVMNLLSENFLFVYFCTLAFYFLLFGLLLGGPANKHTANDNTSGVITLLELYSTLTEEEKAKTCIVFFDNEELGLLGSTYFRKKHKGKLKDKLLINFDCVSDGDYIFVAASKTARSRWNIANIFRDSENKKVLFEKAERVFYPSDQMGFPNTVAIAALKHHKLLGYYMDRIHTNRDTVFDWENIYYLQEVIRELLHS